MGARAAPPLAERFGRRRWEVAGHGPASERAGSSRDRPAFGAPVLAREAAGRRPGQLLCSLVTLACGEGVEEGLHRELLGVEAAAGGHLAGAQVGQEARDLDLDRADLPAGPAQRGGVGQRAALSRCPRAAASGSLRSGPDRPSRTRARPPGRRPGTRSGRRCSGCSGAPGGRPRRRASAPGRCREE